MGQWRYRSASLTIPSNYNYIYNYNCIYNYKHNSSHSVNCIPLRRTHKKDAGGGIFSWPLLPNLLPAGGLRRVQLRALVLVHQPGGLALRQFRHLSLDDAADPVLRQPLSLHLQWR